MSRYIYLGIIAIAFFLTVLGAVALFILALNIIFS